MLNLSEHNTVLLNTKKFISFRLLRRGRLRPIPLSLIVGFVLVSLLSLYLPWTQNIQTRGYVTTLLPEQRPQSIQSVISGRLDRWYVREGDFVEAGDTIIALSEIKSEYFDPNLISRTSEQVQAKSQSIQSYDDKVKALQRQYLALRAALSLKIEQTNNKILQAHNKIKIDSIDLVAYEINLKIAENQLLRTKELHAKGLKTLTEFQEKELKLQQSKAKATVQQNKLLNQRNALVNLILQRSTVEKEYDDKLAKSQSDRQSALAAKLESIVAASKLQNQLSNYSKRRNFYRITAPQSGYITKAIKKGIGEVIKDGADIATIVPASYDLAVELYMKPQDLPLLSTGNHVQLRFDGWPAIVISGWPQTSTGVFSGYVVVIDRFISDNGYYRILVSPDTNRKVWPAQLRVGTGANAFILLKDVPIWYEVWRQLNGFPPDFYQKESAEKDKMKRKDPLKSVK